MTTLADQTVAAPRGTAGTRPILAVITNEMTPYRLHLHRRIVSELPEFDLHTLLCRDSAWSSWKFGDLPEIGLVKLAEGELPHTKNRIGRFRSQGRAARAAVEWLSSRRIGAVIVSGYDERVQRGVMAWCRRTGVPALMHADSNIDADTVTGWKRSLKRAILPRILRKCAAIMCFGSAGREYFRRYGVPDRSIFYVPLEPEYQQLEALSPGTIQQAAQKYGLQTGRRRFVVSSRLVDYKRVDLAIDAFAALAGEFPQWDLVVLGGGPLLEELKTRVPQNLRDRVIFTGFVGEQAMVSGVYRSSDVLIHPSSYEPWALVVNEAAAAGLAIISTNVVGAARELVRDGVNGHIVPANDGPALIAAMRSVIQGLVPMQAASRRVLADWRERADPVNGLRGALRFVGALNN